jgi:hypothetical protein
MLAGFSASSLPDLIRQSMLKWRSCIPRQIFDSLVNMDHRVKPGGDELRREHNHPVKMKFCVFTQGAAAS